MQPEIHLGPITLQTFGVMFALAFLAAGALLARRLQEWGKPTDWAYELILFALIGGLVGARLDFIIENYDSVKDDLLGNIFSGAGLVWYGGVIGGAIGVGLWAWWRGMLNAALLDLCAAPLALGYAIGRIGCQISGDGDYGKAWDGPWAMAYPEGTEPIDETVHPTPLEEHLTGVRRQDAGQAVQQRGFAGAARSHHGHHLAGADRHVHTTQCRGGTEVLVQPVPGQQRAHSWISSVSTLRRVAA